MGFSKIAIDFRLNVFGNAHEKDGHWRLHAKGSMRARVKGKEKEPKLEQKGNPLLYTWLSFGALKCCFWSALNGFNVYIDLNVADSFGASIHLYYAKLLTPMHLLLCWNFHSNVFIKCHKFIGKSRMRMPLFRWRLDFGNAEETRQTQSVNECDSNSNATSLIAYLQVSNELRKRSDREEEWEREREVQRKWNGTENFFSSNSAKNTHTNGYIRLRIWDAGCYLSHAFVICCIKLLACACLMFRFARTKWIPPCAFVYGEWTRERTDQFPKKIFLDTPYHHWLVGWLVVRFFLFCFFWFIISQLPLQWLRMFLLFDVQFSILFVMIYFLSLVRIFRSPSLMFNVHAQ